jgi:hypothetical protein
MKKLSIILLSFLSCWAAYGQTEQRTDTVSFERIIQKFKESWRDPFSGQTDDSISRISLHKTKDFNVSISDNPLIFDIVHLVIKNPYYTEDFDDYDDNYINYPTSYSVIYDGKLISLFRNGKFVCHDLNGMHRDFSYEKRLNTKKFKYHWVISNKLHALVGGSIYVWANNKWTKSKAKFPIDKRPVIFEDSDFVVFGDCSGEFGGTIYFFDKISREIYFTESTCTNSVIKQEGKYLVLAHLGHMMGSSEVKSIENPRKLSKAKTSEINKAKPGSNLGYSDKSEAYEKQLDLFGIQLFSSFKYEDRQLYIAHLKELTFLAEIDGTEIKIVHPLFDDEFYTHDPITNTYGDYTLMNLDFYGTALDKEVSVMIIHKDKIIKVDWNENQSR